jgi:thiamine pyrophosphate-dependent acetolactate synthase large subunit-like protein
MNRMFAGGLIQAALGPEDLVVCSLGSVNRTWRALGAPQPAYFCSDPMGIAVSIGLGLALAQPNRRVAMLCGDGELLMSLSVLATVAGAAPSNLRIVVFNNGRYETGGGQPLSSPQLSFAGVARAAGFAWAHETAVEAEAKGLVGALFERTDLGLLSLAIDQDALGYGPPAPWSQAEERAFFMQRLSRP